MLVKERKQEIIKEFGLAENDCGSSAVQIALLTERIKQISSHLEKFPKDKHSRQGLLKLVGQKKRHASYLLKNNKEKHDEVMQKLTIKK